MRSSIATYKESLSRIASEVLDAADDLEPPQSLSTSTGDDAATTPGRRVSHKFRHSGSPTVSPVPNGSSPVSPDEVAKYKADIQKIQASEAEMKALSFNYAAILKEKEEQLSRLREENSSLRKNFEGKNVGGPAASSGSPQISSNSSNTLKGTVDMSPGRLNRSTNKGKMDQRIVNSQEIEKELPDFVEKSMRPLAPIGADIASELKELKAQLNKERENFKTAKIKFQEEHQLNESFQKELHVLKMETERASVELNKLQKVLNEKISELRRLQVELDRKNKQKDPDETIESLKISVKNLEKENATLKVEKNELNASVEQLKEAINGKIDADDSATSNCAQNLDKVKELELMTQQLEKSLENAHKERDKAVQELARLKQHLLEQELEESNKMDEDSKIIEELRSNFEYQRLQILQLEKALKQETAKKEEIQWTKNEELQKLSEIINGLKQKVATCMSTIDAKNVELLNLQTVLGQYYAESEAKERLERDLVLAKEESAKLSQMLKVANEEQEKLRREHSELFSRLSKAEKLLSESKNSTAKLENENSKLRRALEQSMTTLNRMSLDSDNYVDRRIVIKLLVTYFQRNHSKEVLDLMVRMLGFSEEDKQRIGFAQQGAGKGVVRGVLGLPGRMVGGILGGSSHKALSQASSDNQSFADLWVDFLLKETEERERRESAEVARMSPSTQGSAMTTSVSDLGTNLPGPSYSGSFPLGNQFSTPGVSPIRGLDQSESEFATVPLSSPLSESNSRFLRQPPRY